MNEAQVRRALLVRAYESPPSPPWSEADADAATREAARSAGESADDETLIARRAGIAAERIVARDDAAARVLAAASSDKRWIGWALVAVAFAIGVAGDAIGPSRRINIVAPPLLALLAWNVAVYVLLVARPRPFGALRAALQRALRRAAPAEAPPLARFAAQWAAKARPLHEARAVAVLHAAAAALALGALASLYLRGLALEYRAGWESTFLTAPAVHWLLGIVLGPASFLTGLPLPDASALDALRFANGPGENAAKWIHLYAVTLAAVVVVPRAALAAIAAWRARRAASQLPLSLDEPYYQRLLRAARGAAVAVRVLPCSYTLPAESRPALRAALERHFGTSVTLDVAPSQSLDEPPPAPASGAETVALFPLTATPERETHGAFVDALARSGGRVVVLVDESAFRQRFGANRLAERRAAWQRMLAEVGLAPEFVDLA